MYGRRCKLLTIDTCSEPVSITTSKKLVRYLREMVLLADEEWLLLFATLQSLRLWNRLAHKGFVTYRVHLMDEVLRVLHASYSFYPDIVPIHSSFFTRYTYPDAALRPSTRQQSRVTSAAAGLSLEPNTLCALHVCSVQCCLFVACLNRRLCAAHECGALYYGVVTSTLLYQIRPMALTHHTIWKKAVFLRCHTFCNVYSGP